MIITENYRIFIIKFILGHQAIMHMFINRIYSIEIWQNDRLSAALPSKIQYVLIFLWKIKIVFYYATVLFLLLHVVYLSPARDVKRALRPAIFFCEKHNIDTFLRTPGYYVHKKIEIRRMTG